jgi:hypothetical protein
MADLLAPPVASSSVAGSQTFVPNWNGWLHWRELDPDLGVESHSVQGTIEG